MDPLARVARWEPVSDRWFLHRAEPLLHERMWGCSLPLPEEQRQRQGWHTEAGYAADGTPIAWRYAEAPDDPRPPTAEIVVVEEGVAVVRLTDGGEARTILDEHGRPVRTDYSEGYGSETYEYDAAGRLVVIEESDELWMTAGTSDRFDSGGRLTVEHDDEGPRRITSRSGPVWERLERPWPETLDAGADAIARGCVELTRRACEEHGVAPGTEVFALSLTYVDQGSLHVTLSFGLESDRQEWRREGCRGEAMAINLLYLIGDGQGLNYIEDEVAEPDVEVGLLRAACIQQTDDPYRAALGAVAQRLAQTDWSPMLRPTGDFVVFIAEHDEGFAPKVRSIRAHNPPERVARWEASWPDGAPRGEDERY